MKTDTETMIAALRILSRDIQSDDGVANACIAEAADLIERLQTENERLHRIANYVGGSPHPIPWDQLQQRYIDEIEQLKLAKAELVEVLAGVNDRLDYLIDLWGNEGVTNRVVQSINAAIAKHGGGK